MSPLDDALRAALHARADVLTPSPDPLAGVERRARRIRRNRTLGAVTGSVLAVAAIALGVPALTTTTATAPTGPAVAPTSVTTSAAPAGGVRLDPSRPWEYRGDQAVRRALSDAAATQWANEHRSDDLRWAPLFGQVYEPSGRQELVFLARTDGKDSYGLARSTGSGAEIVVDLPLPSPATVLALALDGDEVARLLAVAAPGTTVQYAAGAASGDTDMTEVADGVAVTPLEGDPATDSVQVLDRDGRPVSRTDAPDPPGRTQPPPTGAPDNLLGWPFRGRADPALEERAAAAYARAAGADRADVSFRVLTTGGTDGGLRYSLLEAWVRGRRAQVLGWVERRDGTQEPVLQPLSVPGEPVVALLLTSVPGRTTDELVVVPQPGTGQVLYAPAGGRERPVASAPGLDGIVLVDRALDAQGDRLRLLDGNGNLDAPTFDGPVFDLLCGEKGCG